MAIAQFSLLSPSEQHSSSVSHIMLRNVRMNKHLFADVIWHAYPSAFCGNGTYLFTQISFIAHADKNTDLFTKIQDTDL